MAERKSFAMSATRELIPAIAGAGRGKQDHFMASKRVSVTPARPGRDWSLLDLRQLAPATAIDASRG